MKKFTKKYAILFEGINTAIKPVHFLVLNPELLRFDTEEEALDWMAENYDDAMNTSEQEAAKFGTEGFSIIPMYYLVLEE